jgi:hypothetical protein
MKDKKLTPKQNNLVKLSLYIKERDSKCQTKK